MQRLVAVALPEIRIGALGQQQGDHVGPTVVGRMVQGCRLGVRILPVNVRPLVQEQLDRPAMSAQRRQM